MVGPKKGAEFGLYKPRQNSKSGLVHQVDAECYRGASRNQKPENTVVFIGEGLFFYLWFFFSFYDFL